MAQINEEFTYTWIIENYSLFDIKNGYDIHSPDFDIDGINGFLAIYPRGDKESDPYVHFSVMRLYNEYDTNSRSSLKISFKIDFCSINEKVLITSEEIEEIQHRTGKQYVFRNLIKSKDLQKYLMNFKKDVLIVRCRMTMTEGATGGNPLCIFQSKSFMAKTVLCLDEYSFMHKINPSYNEKFFDKKFSTTLDESVFEITLQNPEDYVLLKVNRLKGDDKQRFKCQVSWFDIKGKEIYRSCDIHQFYGASNDWHFPNFFGASSQGKLFLRKLFSESGSSIKFSCFVLNGITIEELVDETMAEDPSLLEDPDIGFKARMILNETRSKFLSEKDADVKFRVGKEVIPAHRNILVKQASEFAAILLKKTKETHGEEINISDMKAKTFKLFLKFIYTDMLDEVNTETALELLAAAEKYQMLELKDRAAIFLKSRLTNDNVCDVISVADKVRHHSLKFTAINYIKRNIPEITSSRKWLRWIQNNAELCSEILCSFSQDIKTMQE